MNGFGPDRSNPKHEGTASLQERRRKVMMMMMMMMMSMVMMMVMMTMMMKVGGVNVEHEDNDGDEGRY